MIYIGSDHGGYSLKEQIKEFLDESKLSFEDLGPAVLNPGDDYFDYAAPVAEKVAADSLNNLGIVICRSGQGVNIVANKFKGIRAALVWNQKEARMSRTDDFVNMLSLPADYISADEARSIVKAWLETPQGTDERHIRRVQKIKDLENNLYK